MMYTSVSDIKRAISLEDIKPGMTYTTTAGLFQIVDLDGNGDIIGHAAEMEIDEEGNAEANGVPAHITAVDLIGAEF